MGQDLSLRVYSPDRAAADRVLAEAQAAGAAGVVEEPGDGIALTIYLDSEGLDALMGRLEGLRPVGVRFEPCEVVEPQSWSESWKSDHAPVEISARLRIRPPFLPASNRSGQIEIVIDPGQAFGTGQHESTRLALEGIEERLGVRAKTTPRLLDVGTGSGVLGLAGLAMGVDRAVGHDLDPVAVHEAERHAEANGLVDRFQLFVGPIQALRPSTFDVVVVNMLRSEMIPIATEIAGCVGDELILSGLLDSDVDSTLNRFGLEGLVLDSSREARDESGNQWVGLSLTRS